MGAPTDTSALSLSVESDLDPDDQLVDRTIDYMFQVATMSLPTLNCTQTVVRNEAEVTGDDVLAGQ